MPLASWLRYNFFFKEDIYDLYDVIEALVIFDFKSMKALKKSRIVMIFVIIMHRNITKFRRMDALKIWYQII